MVSIIVPIFNRERELKRCVDSILCQTYSNIEVLLVDDGSTDASGKICEEYAAKDPRVQVIHQENIGASLSRIRAIGKIHGEYVQFVDSDDWIEPNMVARLLEEMHTTGVDMVWCNVMLHCPNEKICNIPFDANPLRMLNDIYTGEVSAWLFNKLYCTKLWQDIEPTGDDIVEDIFYMTQILLTKPSISFVAMPLYHYDQTSVNALTSVDDFWVKCLPNYERCYRYFVSHQCLTPFKSSLLMRILKSKFILLNQGRLKEAQDIASFANTDIRNYPISFPVSIIYWIGFNSGAIGRRFLSVYLRCWRHQDYQ